MLLSLASTRMLWTTFILTLMMTFAFQYLAGVWALSFIDAMSDPEVVRAEILAMSAEQRTAHAWITATLDVAYPLTYGALFAGSAQCFFPKWGARIGAAMAVLVAVDLLEGVVQVLALTGVTDWLDAKQILTPAKTGLFLAGFAIMVAGWVVWLIRRIRANP